MFDRLAVRRHRDRAAATLPVVADILDELSQRLLDRLDDTTHHFTEALDIGGRGAIAPALRARGMRVVSIDPSPRLAACAGGLAVAGDAEFMPLAPGKFDLAIACLSLHWINDLPGALIQIRQSLRPDGLFLASVPVLGTLDALRRALTATEAELTGGASPRVSPFPDLRDCASLLQRAGFALPVADVEDIELVYADPFALLRDLRAAGETNAVRLRSRRPPPPALFPTALAAMRGDGEKLRINLRLATLTGWAPSATQPQPLKPGTGQVSLTKFLNSDG
ncbi:MAG TPA: methyltransferase domain-containing protein [Acetobacteraceae bacterium]|nr:methyltransferase domain-containing protein [Acetobacteraceae bacterium]